MTEPQKVRNLALFDRIFVGMTKDGFTTRPGFTSIYVLNPRIKGPIEVKVQRARTWPTFVSLPTEADEILQGRVRMIGTLAPWWISRFIVFETEDVLFGFITYEFDVECWHAYIVGFEPALIVSLYGERLAKYHQSVSIRNRVSRAVVKKVLVSMFELIIETGGGKRWTIHDSQGIKSPAGTFQGIGGDA